MKRYLVHVMLVMCAAWSASAGARVTPEQAVEGVRELLEIPEMRLADPPPVPQIPSLPDDGATVAKPSPAPRIYGSPFGWPGLCYDLDLVAPGWVGSAWVRLSDGVVMCASLLPEVPAGVPPAPPPDHLRTSQRPRTWRECERIATAFAKRHFPGFEKKRWEGGRSGPNSNGELAFWWTEVLNKHGVLAPRPLEVEVQQWAGRVTGYADPRIPITAPIVPQLTREDATRVARAHAPLDPARYPFRKAQLQAVCWSGEQRLEWYLRQRDDPEDRSMLHGVSIDALTGEVTWAWVRGHGVPWPNRARTTPPRPILLHKANGHTAALADTAGAAYLDGDVLWTRLESLALYDARITDEDGPLQVRLGDRIFAPEQLGAQERTYGWYAALRKPVDVRNWWVPVKQAAEALGWQYEPDLEHGKVTIRTEPAPKRTGRQSR